MARNTDRQFCIVLGLAQYDYRKSAGLVRRYVGTCPYRARHEFRRAVLAMSARYIYATLDGPDGDEHAAWARPGHEKDVFPLRLRYPLDLTQQVPNGSLYIADPGRTL